MARKSAHSTPASRLGGGSYARDPSTGAVTRTEAPTAPAPIGSSRKSAASADPVPADPPKED